MKKFLSIIIALLLTISLFATTAVAFAAEGDLTITYAVGDTDKGKGEAPEPAVHAAGDEVTLAAANTFSALKGYEFAGWLVEGETDVREAGSKYIMPDHSVTITAQWKEAHKVTVDNDKLMEFLAVDGLKMEMGRTPIGKTLMASGDNIRATFNGIKYVASGEDDYDAVRSTNDKIYVEYCRPSESPKGQENWQNSTQITSATTEVNLSSSGWYLLRFVIKDSTDTNVLAVSDKISRYVEDSKHPVISLSTSMSDKVNDGLTAGTKYSISTSLSITDSSSTTVTYKIYKVVNGEDVLVYDSETKEVTEGYEEFIDSEGAITPSKDDISTEPVYKIRYAVKDANGYYGVANDESAEQFFPEMALKVNAPESKKTNKINAVEIVLFCIAGLAAVGIVVLLFIKPKQQTETPRSAAVKTDGTDNGEKNEDK